MFIHGFMDLREPILTYVCFMLKFCIHQVTECLPNKAKVGKAFKQSAKAITSHLSSLSPESALDIKNKLASEG